MDNDNLNNALSKFVRKIQKHVSESIDGFKNYDDKSIEKQRAGYMQRYGALQFRDNTPVNTYATFGRRSGPNNTVGQ